MWLTLNKGLLPDYLVEVPFLIRRLLVYRFLCATLYCICMEFGVLAVFLLCVILPVKGSPISWLCYVIKWTFFSIYTWILILPLFIGIGLYGLLLCRMHNIRPECHHVLFDRFKHNFLHKFYLMCITVALSCYTTWMYRGYIMKQLTRSEQLVMKITYADGYLMAFGNLCGLSYFFTQYAPSSFKGFNLPIASSAILVCILRQISRSSLKEAVKTTLISATVFSQFCNPGHDLLYHSWCLGMAISIQLHLARCIYSLVWQAKLPLSLQNFYPHSANIPMHKLLLKRLKVWFCYGVMLPVHYEDVKDIENSRKLPLFMALDCGVLHGFQMQAAMEFSATINKPIMFKQIFNVDKITGCRSWRDLRNIVMGKVNDFRIELATLLSEYQSEGHDSPELTHPRQMRSIIRPCPETLCSQCRQKDIGNEDECSLTDPQPNFFQIYLIALRDKLANLIQQHWLYVKIDASWHRFSGENNSLAELNRILISAEPLGFALQGIVWICVISLRKNDRYVVWDEDVKRIMKSVLELTKVLGALEDHEILNSGKLCSSYRLLRWTVLGSMYHLLSAYNDYLEVLLLDDWPLYRELKKLSRKM